MKSIYTLSQTPIIITDLDGTILVDGKLENEVINTFKKIQSMGISITFSTGRSKIPASKYAELLNLPILSTKETLDLFLKSLNKR